MTPKITDHSIIELYFAEEQRDDIKLKRSRNYEDIDVTKYQWLLGR